MEENLYIINLQCMELVTYSDLIACIGEIWIHLLYMMSTFENYWFFR